MAKLKWDQTGEKFYETGVEQCALYKKSAGNYGTGVAWNGIIGISENPSGAEPTALWADNKKYLNLMSAEEYGANIEAYTYPEEFEECDGSLEIAPGVYAGQQNRSEFGLAYKSLIGNDENGTDLGYKLHIVYNCLASPSEKAHNSVNDSPEADSFSWEISTTPEEITTLINGKKAKPTATLTIDSRKTPAEKLKALEDKLFGTEDAEATLPTPDEVITLIGAVVAG